MEPSTPSSDHSRQAAEVLPAGECLRLLASVQAGRIIYTRKALPAVELVNFAMDAGDIVILTDAGNALAVATQHTVVAFEADEFDAVSGRGWSVTVVGLSREVTDPQDIGRLREKGLHSWPAGGGDHFIRITPGIVNAQRLAYR